jgi:hypothetical protein
VKAAVFRDQHNGDRALRLPSNHVSVELDHILFISFGVLTRVWIAPKHLGILLARKGHESLIPSARHQRRQGFVEAYMAGFADSQELHVNPSCLSNELLVPRSPRTQISRHAIRDMRVGKVDIHPAKKVMIHVKPSTKAR